MRIHSVTSRFTVGCSTNQQLGETKIYAKVLSMLNRNKILLTYGLSDYFSVLCFFVYQD